MSCAWRRSRWRLSSCARTARSRGARPRGRRSTTPSPSKRSRRWRSGHSSWTRRRGRSTRRSSSVITAGSTGPPPPTANPARGAEPVERDAAAELISVGGAILGIELGSTRIKASLIAPDTTPLASGWHSWENRLVDGVWTYDLADVWAGLADCYASLLADVRSRYAVDLGAVAAMGVSGMMHGYIALDRDGELLTPFRTWRNNITGPACAELTPLLHFAVPQRWTIAHLYQSILEDQLHVAQIARVTTLAGYVHWRLTGEHVLGVGEASGVFPIDPGTGDWDMARMAKFDDLVAPRRLGWAPLRAVLPDVRAAGVPAGTLTAEGARRLDPAGRLPAGLPLCPPEGDAGTG